MVSLVLCRRMGTVGMGGGGGTYVHVASRGGGVMVAMVHCVCHFGDFGSSWLVLVSCRSNAVADVAIRDEVEVRNPGSWITVQLTNEQLRVFEQLINHGTGYAKYVLRLSC